MYHRLPVALLDVRVTLPPVQNVVGPLGVTVGVGVAGMVTLVEADLRHPAASTMLSVSPTLPDAPAVYVTDCDAVLPAIVPFVMDHA